MIQHPSFSIIVPVYKVEKYIERCAVSLFSQSYDKIQFVFVNDGTTDRSIEILEALIDSKYKHLKPAILIINKNNEGPAVARKRGLEKATGDYILYVDSDDYIESDLVRLLADEVEKSGADYIYFGLQKEYSDRISYKPDVEIKCKDDYLLKMMSGKALPSLCTKCMRRSLYENDIFYPEFSYAEDLLVSIQLAYYARNVVHLNSILYHYDRSNPLSSTTGQKSRNHSFACKNFLDFFNHFGEKMAGTPLEIIAPSMMFRVAWYTLIHKLDYFKTHPELTEYIKNAPTGRNYYIPIFAQLYLKFYIKYCM